MGFWPSLLALQVVSFDKEAWSAQYCSHDPQHRPTSDTPLLQVGRSSSSSSSRSKDGNHAAAMLFADVYLHAP
jgi:hypothetical protein